MSKILPEESNEDIEIVPLESIEFPRDSPSFWNSLEKQHQWAAGLQKDLEDQVTSFGPDFKTVNTSHFDDYHKFMAKNTSVYDAIPALEELNKALKSLNELRMKLTASFQKWEALNKKGIDELKDFQTKEEELWKQKATYLAKVKTYLTTKLTRRVSEKAPEKDKKMRVRKQDLAKSRVEALLHFQRLQIQKEVMLLSPMVECLNAYSEFFKAGNALLQPLHGKIARFTEYVQKRADLIASEEKKLGALKADWEKQLAAAETAAVDVSAHSLSGIRDLDAIRSGVKQTDVKKKEGYLFVQQPHFQRVWCSVDGENFTVHNSLVVEDDISVSLLDGLLQKRKRESSKPEPKIPDIVLPMYLCSVKETPDEKFRFGFAVISPPQTRIALQADSYEEMRDWLQVIQNAIASGLTGSQSGKNPSKEQKSPPPLPGKEPSLPSIVTPPDEDSEQKALAWQLQELRQVKGNEICADCSTKNPEWVSLNLGIMMCVTCSGIHRSLGVHISKVRSLLLDKLDRFALETVKCVGNENALDVWESKLQTSDKLKKSHKPNKSSRNWIKAKYETKNFVGDAKEDLSYNPQKALFQAIEERAPLDVLKALGRGAEPNKPNDSQDNRTSLHHAVMYGDYRSIDLIALNGGDLTCQESRGWTPLHYAGYQDDPDLCELLLLRGGSRLATIQSVDGKTALETARQWCESGTPKCVPILEKALAQVAAKQAAAAAAEAAAAAAGGGGS